MINFHKLRPPGEDIYLQLPGETTVFDIRWFSLYDQKANRDLGHLIIPDQLNVPPSLVDVVATESALPNCVMLDAPKMVEATKGRVSVQARAIWFTSSP